MPSMIAAFVKAKNDRDRNAVVVCFADDAVVHGEGQEMAWRDRDSRNEATKAVKNINSQLIQPGIVKGDKEIMLTAALTGNFLEIPISLDFNFTISKLAVREGKRRELCAASDRSGLRRDRLLREDTAAGPVGWGREEWGIGH